MNNFTKIYSILGQPNIKAFLTHGGTSSIYEATYHRIPMVDIPLFAGPPDKQLTWRAKEQLLDWIWT